MNKKKVMQFSILSLVFLSLLTATATAGITDWLKEKLTGEPQLSPFDTTITISNVEPTIIRFIAVDEYDPDENGATGPGTIQGSPGGTEGASTVIGLFHFIVEDLNEPTDLPGGGGATVIQLGTNVIVTFTAPTASLFTNTINTEGCTTSSCVGNPDCTDQTAETNQLEYNCIFAMNYYDPPSPDGGAVPETDRWKITVTVKDSTGTNSDTATSGQAQEPGVDEGFDHSTCLDEDGLDCDYIIYNIIQGVSTNNALSWSGIDINYGDQPADDGLEISNVGNIAVTKETILAYNPVEDGESANYLKVDAFSVGIDYFGACDVGGTAEALINGIGVDLSQSISYSADGSDTADVFFCIWDTLNPNNIVGAPALSYVANDVQVPSNRWSIVWQS